MTRSDIHKIEELARRRPTTRGQERMLVTSQLQKILVDNVEDILLALWEQKECSPLVLDRL